MTEEQIEKNRIRYGQVFDKPEHRGVLGFPVVVVEAMIRNQIEQGNVGDVKVFQRNNLSGKLAKGFDWNETKEDREFWLKVIKNKNFDVFFEKYPELLPKKDVEEVSTEEVVTEEALSVDSFIENNKEALQDISKTNTPLFNALNGVLAELRISYEDDAVQVEEVEEVVEVKEDDLDLDNLMGEIDELDLDSLLDDIDDL